jgi:DNA-binding CsgD family transcriptional regulator
MADVWRGRVGCERSRPIAGPESKARTKQMNRYVATKAVGLSEQLRLQGLADDERRASAGEASWSLESERWTVVVAYEHEGKRFVVARSNDVRLRRPAALSRRERQAVGCALLGNSNKVIAYELGISPSTVGVLLHRAARKLGSHTRVDLIQRFRASRAEPCPAQPTPSI